MKSKILVLISVFTILLLLGARIVNADEVSSHWIGEQDMTLREYFESNVAVFGTLGGYTSADIMAEYDKIVESNPYAVCFYDSGQSSSAKTYVILFLPEGNYSFERASNGLYFYSSLDLTENVLYGCSYNAKGQITFFSCNDDMFEFQSVDTFDTSNFIYKYFASSVSRTSYFKSYSGCGVSAPTKSSFYRPVFSNIDFQFDDSYDTYSYSYTACFTDSKESTDDIFYDVIYSNNTNNLVIGWQSNIAGYMYGGFDKIDISVDMTAYDENDVGTDFSYSTSSSSLSSTAGSSSTGIMSSGNYYTGASLSQYNLCKSLSGAYDCVTVNAVTVTFGYNNYDYTVTYYHSNTVVLYGTLPTSGGSGIGTDSEINSNLDDMWQNTDYVPDVHILVNTYLHVSGGFVTFNPVDDVVFHGWENVLYCTVISDSQNDLSDYQLIADGLDVFLDPSFGGALSFFADFFSSILGEGSYSDEYINRSSLNYYLTTFSSVYDVIVYTSFCSDGEISSCPTYVFYTDRFYIKSQLFNFDDKIDEITKALVYNYNVSYNTYTYIKYRLDEMNDNSILFYNSALDSFETSNVYLKSMTSTLSNVLIRLNSIDTSINTLDTNISNYILSQTNTLVAKIDELTSKTFNVSDDDIGVIEKLISIYDLISGLDVGGGDDTSILDLIGKILDLLNGFNSDGIKLDNDLNVNVQLATGGVAYEIDTPQELGFNWWDSEIDELTSKIVNGMSGWYIDIIKIMNEQNTDNVFNNVSDMIQLFDEANDPIYEFFDSEFDIYRYE